MPFRPVLVVARRVLRTPNTTFAARQHHIPIHRFTPRPFSTSTSFTSSTPMAAETDTSASEVASSHNITPDTLSATLKQKIGATYVSIEDMSGGCGQAFNAIIVSPEFEKKPLLARHRLVNNALKQEIAAIHAWTPKCLTPEQWEKERERLG